MQAIALPVATQLGNRTKNNRVFNTPTAAVWSLHGDEYTERLNGIRFSSFYFQLDDARKVISFSGVLGEPLLFNDSEIPAGEEVSSYTKEQLFKEYLTKAQLTKDIQINRQHDEE